MFVLDRHGAPVQIQRLGRSPEGRVHSDFKLAFANAFHTAHSASWSILNTAPLQDAIGLTLGGIGHTEDRAAAAERRACPLDGSLKSRRLRETSGSG